MTRMLYDLAGAGPELRFSPFCWRARLSLAHKELEVETLPLALHREGPHRLLRPEPGAGVGGWRPHRRRFLGDRRVSGGDLSGPAGPVRRRRGAGAGALRQWLDGRHPGPWIGRLVVRDILDCLRPEDRGYFRESREKRFGMSLEAVVADRKANLPAFRRELQPVRLALRAQPFLAGAAPAYADYIVFGAFQWARCVSGFRLLEADDPVHAWRGRMLDRFGGLARRAPGHEV